MSLSLMCLKVTTILPHGSVGRVMVSVNFPGPFCFVYRNS